MSKTDEAPRFLGRTFSINLSGLLREREFSIIINIKVYYLIQKAINNYNNPTPII